MINLLKKTFSPKRYSYTCKNFNGRDSTLYTRSYCPIKLFQYINFRDDEKEFTIRIGTLFFTFNMFNMPKIKIYIRTADVQLVDED